jgi:hypothetical protein
MKFQQGPTAPMPSAQHLMQGQAMNQERPIANPTRHMALNSHNGAATGKRDKLQIKQEPVEQKPDANNSLSNNSNSMAAVAAALSSNNQSILLNYSNLLQKPDQQAQAQIQHMQQSPPSYNHHIIQQYKNLLQSHQTPSTIGAATNAALLVANFNNRFGQQPPSAVHHFLNQYDQQTLNKLHLIQQHHNFDLMHPQNPPPPLLPIHHHQQQPHQPLPKKPSHHSNNFHQLVDQGSNETPAKIPEALQRIIDSDSSYKVS